MPLITQTSDLRMYRRPTIGTMDRRGGGSSNQPYTLATRPMGIPNDIRDENDSKLPRLGLTGGPDLFNRGGLNAPRRGLIDAARLASYFYDLKSPSGPLFLVKQNLLSRTSVKTEASFGPGYGAGSLTADKTNSFEKGVFVNEKGGFINQGLIPGSYLLTPLGILGQAAAGWSGLHLNAFGLDPTSPMTGVVGRSGEAGINRYSDVIQLQNEGEEYLKRNRLIGLYEGKIINEDETQVILEYGGGPGSVLGVGKTRIPRFTFTGFNNPKVKSDLEKGVGERSNTIVVKDKGYLPGLTHWEPFIVPYDYYNVLEYGSDEEGFNPPNRGASFRYNQMYPDTDLNANTTLNLNNSDDGLLVRLNNTPYASTSSLDPREDIKSYQVGKQQINSSEDNFVEPLGASSLYEEITEYKIPTDESTENTLGIKKTPTTWEPSTNPSVYISQPVSGSNITKPSLTPKEGVTDSLGYYNSTYLARWGRGSLNETNSPNNKEINYFNLLGVSNVWASQATSEFVDPDDPTAYIFNRVYNSINDDGQKFDTFNYSVYNYKVHPETGQGYSYLANTSNPLRSRYNTHTFPQNDFTNYTTGNDLFNTGVPGGEEKLTNSIINLNGGMAWRQNPNPQDFRKRIIQVETDFLNKDFDAPLEPARRVLSISPDYKTKSRRTRISAGDPGFSNTSDGRKDVYNYGVPAHTLHQLENVTDRITALPPYERSMVNTKNAVNDFVKFRIAILNNDNPSKNLYLHFRAFLDSMSDAYNATWSPIQYVGRGDNFYNYTGFNRSISLGFTVFAQSKAELVPMYYKLNELAGSLAPDYTEAGMMRGNMVRLTVGGYIYEQPGFISSLNYDIVNEAPWEISINEQGGADTSVKELPHMIKVTGLTFTPVHDFLVRKGQRFISLSTGRNSLGLYNNKTRYKELKGKTPYKNDANYIPGEG